MPDDSVESQTQFYSVLPDQPVELWVVVGDAQAGGTSVTIGDGTLLLTDGRLNLGPGASLRNKLAHCITTVKDVNPDTNRADVTYHLAGGADGEQSFPFTGTIAEDGGFARFFIDIAFL
ncbi:MAG TPA: hypothetical protein VFH27_11335 [Longimicrobiaceae bacterium]|nr:hypothetical protein [Longimicrobiaceae bacterium]